MAGWFQFLICLVAAAGAFALEPSDWLSIRSEAMVVLSVLAAAVLFRLGRGLPPVSTDELEVEEAKRLAKTFQIVARRLAFVAGVTAVALVGLAVLEVGCRLAALHLPPLIAEWCFKAAGAVLAFVIALAFCRAVMVVLGDLSAIAVQSDHMVKSVLRRRAGEAAAALDEAERAQPFEKPANYGGLIEPH
ncbi:MAG: hypothetical protein OXC28_07370 [Defluviicoccus sp.]|nr:hypothetical protein [Defluviicoccus sp.]